MRRSFRYRDGPAGAAIAPRNRAPTNPPPVITMLDAYYHPFELSPGGRTADPGRRVRKLALKSGSRTFLVDAAAIDWVEAAGNYLIFHAGAERYTVRGTMAEMEARLAPASFVRIHKSTLVNIDRVKSIEPIHAGDQAVAMEDGTELVMSRTYRHRVNTLLDLE
jgi:DNA-binding LytR/AlgR family response regulator